MPLLLTLAPLLLLGHLVREEQSERQADRERQFLERLESRVALVREASSLQFWIERTARQYKAAWARLAALGSGPLADRLARAAAAAARQLAPATRGFPPMRLWVFQTGATPRQGQGPLARPRVLLAPSPRRWPSAARSTALQARAVTSGLGRLMLLATRMAGTDQRGALLQQALTTARPLFGDALHREMFAPEARGQAFHVIFQGRFHYLLWDFLMVAGRPVGAVILTMELPPDAEERALRLTLVHWRTLGGKTPSWPAFGRLPDCATAPAASDDRPSDRPGSTAAATHPTAARPPAPTGGAPRPAPLLLPADLRGTAAARALRQLHQEVVIQPASFSLAELRGKPLSPLLTHALGRLSFPTAQLQRALPLGSHWGRLFVLGPGRTHVGFLVAPAPPPPATSLGRVWQALAVAVLLLWTAFLGGTAVTGRPPTLPVAGQLLAWFFCLVAIPLLLLHASGERLARDLEHRLHAQARRKLTALARHLEGEATRLGQRQAQVVSAHIHRPALLDRLLGTLASTATWPAAPATAIDEHRPLPPSPTPTRGPTGVSPRAAAALADLWQALERDGLQPQVIQIAVGRPTVTQVTRFTDRYSPEEQAQLSKVLLDQAHEDFRAVPGQIEPGNASASPGPFRRHRNFAKGTAGRYGFATLGSRRICRVNQFIYRQGRLVMTINVYWDHTRHYQQRMRQLVQRLHARQGLEAVVLLRQGGRWETIAEAGRTTTLKQAARRVDDRTVAFPETRRRFLRVLHPGTDLAGYVFGLRASLSAIDRRLAAETRALRRLIVASLLLVVMAGLAIAWWVVGPVRAMTVALEHVGQGDFTVRLRSPRADELGQTAHALDRMIAWLAERDRMSRFVATPVMEALAATGGTPEAARRRRMVAMLCDIRAFTTISETHPPPAVFAMLNRHFEEMTPFIRAAGGVIERFIGDAIQAVFWSSADDPAPPRALRAATAMLDRLAQINRARVAAGEFPYRIGIGLAEGEALTGIVGDPAIRQDFSVLGPLLGEAAAREALTRQAQNLPIAVCGKVRAQAGPGWQFLPLPGHPDTWEACPAPAAVPAAARPASADAPSSAAPRGSGPSESIARSAETADPAALDGGGAGPGAAAPRSRRLAAGQDLGREGGWGPTALLAAFWMMTILLLGEAEQTWRQAWANHFRAGQRDALRHDLRLTQGTAVAGFQIPQRWCTLVDTTLAAPAPAWADTPRQHAELLARLARWPASGSWFIVRPAPPDQITTLITSVFLLGEALFGEIPDQHPSLAFLLDLRHWTRQSAARLLPQHRPALAFLARLLWRSSGHLTRRLWESRITAARPGAFPRPSGEVAVLASMIRIWYDSGVRHPDGRPLEKLFLNQLWNLGNNALDDLLRMGFRGLGHCILGGQGYHVFWLPLPAARPAPVFQHLLPLRGPLPRLPAAAILIGFFPQETLTGRSSLRPLLQALRADAARRGTALAFQPLEDGPAISHPWFRHPRARAGRTGAPASRAPPPELLVEQAGLEVGGRPYRVTALRRLSRQPPLPLGLRGLAIFRVAWLWLGLGAAVLWLIRPVPLPLGLTGRLTAAFLIVVAPVLALSAIVLQRRFEASRPGLTDRRLADLQLAVNRFEESHLARLGWAERLVRSRLHDPDVLAACRQAERARRPAPSGDAPLILELADWLFRHGVGTTELAITGGHDLVLGRERVAEGTKGGSRFLGALFAGSLARLAAAETPAPAPGPRDDALLKDAVLEDLRIAMVTFSTPDLVQTFFNSPHAATRIRWGEKAHNFFHCYFPEHRPRYVLFAQWEELSFLGWPLAQWRRFLRTDPGGACEIRLADPTSPAVSYVRPFFTSNHWNLQWPAFASHVLPDRGELAAWVAQASLLGEPLGGVVDPTGPAPTLILAQRSHRFGRYLLTITQDFAPALAALDRQIQVAFLVLGLVILATFALARSVAARFIAPLQALWQAAEQVIGGNFQVILALARRDEFGDLALSFNRMCQDLDAGWRLRRFVSESVQRVAEDVKLAEEARRGQMRERVVLFAGVGGFLEAGDHLPPEAAVARLNAYLSRLAQVVRRHDGEIDKFIGEKILATFAPEPHGSLPAAAGAAVAAARELAATLDRVAPALRHQLGVGIVTGRVLAGILGTPAVRLEYTVLGDPVNLAARLCERAIHQPATTILLDAATARLVETSGLACHSLGAVRVKGKTHDVEVFSLVDV
ncbi:MAG: Adenylate cyclase [Candidatus Ozemobacter sibiricus]|uniref:Adenylate cyclase n=1 Tax=Candidatus Ozemobacter sibiricus TaxID=2268124 RepID=A0A367ZSS3_9BACT|nr:MAG: Adenylate cyclase [Candidatus Ozemobacter sibiricus]